jgi:hypothetical protein
MVAVNNSNKTLIIIIVVIAILLCCCVLGGIGLYSYNINSKPASYNSSTQTVTVAPSNQTAVSVAETGVTKQAGSFAYTLDKVTQDGDNYVFSITIKNNGSGPIAFSSILQFNLVDGDGNEYFENYYYQINDDEFLDGDIAPGQQISGKIAAIVDKDVSSLTLRLSDQANEPATVNFKIK